MRILFGVFCIGAFFLTACCVINGGGGSTVQGYALLYVDDSPNRVRAKWSQDGTTWEDGNFPSISGCG